MTRTTMVKSWNREALLTPRRLNQVKKTMMAMAMILVWSSVSWNSSWKGMTLAMARDAMEPEAVSKKPLKPLTKPTQG